MNGQRVGLGGVQGPTLCRRARLPTLLATATTLTALAGCQMLAAPFVLFAPEPTRTLPAEYPYLAGKKVCLLVWADSYTLMEYPFVQLEVSEHAAAEMKQRIRGASFVPNRAVVDYQRQDPDWDRAHPAAIGQKFGSDRVVVIELTQYTTREPESTYLYRGRIGANLRVYNTQYPDAGPAYRATVETLYPPDSHGQWGSSEDGLRKATMEAFARDLTGKFYDRQVKVQ